jgi:putative tryptophan/tyrosine transport system substrate-binding protein
MQRRRLISLLGGAAAWPVVARAQQKARPVIGLLDLGAGGPTDHFLDVFRGDLKKRGLEDGRDLQFLGVQAAGGENGLSAAAHELVDRKPDVVIVFGDPATRVMQQATTLIPIVAMTDDMVGSGLVGGLARPGGNTTGLSILASELDVKRLELLHEAVPQAARIGVLADSTSVATRSRLEQAADALGVKLVIARFASSDEAVRAADQLAGTGVGAANVLASPLIGSVRQTIIDRLNRAAVPAIYQWPEYARLGGLFGYGPDLLTCRRQVAALAEKILNGAKPSDLPVEQPTKFELVINLKTAKALGLTVPQLLLARADELIE